MSNLHLTALLVIGAAVAGAALAATEREERKESLTWRRDASSLALNHGGRPVWRFRHVAKLGKPHFDAPNASRSPGQLR